MEFKAKELAEILGGTVDGNPEAKVTTFARIESGKPGAICFFANPKYEHYVYNCKADIIIVNKDFEPKEPVSATLLRVDDSYAAVASLLDYVTAKKKVIQEAQRIQEQHTLEFEVRQKGLCRRLCIHRPQSEDR